MRLSSRVTTDKSLFAMTLGSTALIIACLPLAQKLDDRTDRTRPMYEDRASMEWLQWQKLSHTGAAEALEVHSGDRVRIAGEVFTPAKGVTVVVRTPTTDSYCVQVSNQYGDVSQWACLDEETPPLDPDAQPIP